MSLLGSISPGSVSKCLGVIRDFPAHGVLACVQVSEIFVLLPPSPHPCPSAAPRELVHPGCGKQLGSVPGLPGSSCGRTKIRETRSVQNRSIRLPSPLPQVDPLAITSWLPSEASVQALTQCVQLTATSMGNPKGFLGGTQFALSARGCQWFTKQTGSSRSQVSSNLCVYACFAGYPFWGGEKNTKPN